MGLLDSLLKVAAIGAAVVTGVGLLVTPGLVAGAAAFGLTGTAAYFASAFATQFVLGAVSSALAKKPDSSSLANAGQTVSSRNPLGSHKTIYGRTRAGGNIVYMATTNSNKYLHIVIAVAGHEIDAFEAVYANDEEVTIDGSGISSGTYGSKIRIKYALGTHTTQPFTDLQTETADLGDGAWTANHLMRGSALVYVRLEYDQDKFPNGVPNFSFLVRGKKVYDPRSASTTWSANPALCLNDFLTNDKYGLGCVYADEIDETALIASANICDQDVSLAAGGTENKYECHGVLSSSERPDDLINKILTSMAGKAVWSQGKWRILAGAYYTPTLTFDEGDLRSGIRVQTLVSRRENFNGVKGIFSSEQDNYIVTDFPQIVSSTAVTEDGGEEVLKSIELPLTTSVTMAQRLAKIELLRARQQITTVLPLKLQGLKANVGDIIQVNNTRLGWSAKNFEVISINLSLGETPGVDLSLREVASDVFSWETSEEQAYDPAPNTNLPNAFQVGKVTDLSLLATDSVAPDGTVLSGMLISWTPPVNSFVTQYEVQYIRGASNFDWGSVAESAASSTNYGLVTDSADSSADYGSIADATAASETEYNSVFVTTPYYVITSAVAGAEYAVRVRAVNTFGVRSAWVTSNEITYGDQSAPDAPNTVVATGGYKQITLSWVNPTVADFDFVEVYRNIVEDSATATRVAVLRGSMFIDGPLGINVTRYYWLKAVDRTGNKSGFTSAVNATTQFIDSDSFSAEVLNLFSEAGAYGIEPVATLPATGDFDGQIKYDTTNNKLWRWDATAEEWTDDIFSITSGSVDEASFAAGIEPVKIVSELPNPSGYTGAKIVFLTTDNKLYRYDGSAWTNSIAAADIDGTLSAENFSQSLRPVEVVSALPSSGNFQGRTVVLTSDNKIYRYTGFSWTAAVPTTDLSGTITAGQIAANAITAGKIAADAVTAGTVASGAIGTDELAANSITAGKIAAAAIGADQIATNAITADKISAGAIQTDKIAANAITGGLIAASGVITSAAQINDAIITNAKIENGAITTAKIGDAQITGAKIANATIASANIADAAITTAKIGTAQVDTLQIAGDAVTVPVSAFTVAGTSLPTGTWKTVQSLVVDSGSFSIPSYITFGFHILDGYRIIQTRLLEGTNVIASWPNIWVGSGLAGSSYSFAFLTPSYSGAKTYNLQVYTSSAANTVSHRYMNAIGVKR